jgi:hypothetical protein
MASLALIIAQSNILIDHDNHIRVTDFGLSLVGDATKGAFSTTGSGRGSEGWIAPELYSDDKTRRTMPRDVFAFASICYMVCSPLAPQCEGTDVITAHHGQGTLRGQDAADVLQRRRRAEATSCQTHQTEFSGQDLGTSRVMGCRVWVLEEQATYAAQHEASSCVSRHRHRGDLPGLQASVLYHKCLEKL